MDDTNPHNLNSENDHKMQNIMTENQFVIAYDHSSQRPALKGKVLSSHVILPNPESKRVERLVVARAAQREQEEQRTTQLMDVANGNILPERKWMPFKFRRSDSEEESGSGGSDMDNDDDDESDEDGDAPKKRKKASKGPSASSKKSVAIAPDVLRDILLNILEVSSHGRTLKELALKTGQTQVNIRMALKDIADLKSVEYNGSKAQRYVIREAYARNAAQAQSLEIDEPAAKRQKGM